MTQLRLDTGQVIAVRELVIAGWTGRDEAAVAHHIAELAALGVPAPSSVPLYYRAGAELLTHAAQIDTVGADSSGEAEPLLICDSAGDVWLGLASDHTDRALEAVSVAKSKQICPKPVARSLWRLADLDGRLDDLVLRAEIEEGGAWVPYQEGTLAEIRPLAALITGLPGGQLAPGMAMLCGTLPAIGGIRPAPRFRMQLIDPARKVAISHEYTVTALPVVA